MDSLLPPNETDIERRLEQVSSDLVKAQAPLQTLWDAQRMPANMLPWLGWATGVDRWNTNWPEQAKRDAINEAISIRRRRGTVWAVRRALEVLGVSDVEILEHSRQEAAWLDAGGLQMDGSWSTDGSVILGGDLVNPPQVVTTNWAQYALALNIADAPFTLDDQRTLRERVEDAAPLRAELVELLYRFNQAWSAAITVAPLIQSVRQSWKGCEGAAVHGADQLMGCRTLSGEYEPRTLTGESRLDGSYYVTGQRPVGALLNEGWGVVDIQVKQPTNAAAQASSRNQWSLGETETDELDASWHLNEVVDGHRVVDGTWRLSLSRLYQSRSTPLDGTRLLGEKTTINAIGTDAHGVLRDRRQRKEIRL